MSLQTAEKPRAADPMARVMAEVRKLGLEANVIELETQGFTTVPAAMPAETLVRAKAAIAARVEKATGRPIDLDRASAEDFMGMQYIPYLLYDDPVFEEVLMERRPLALITYLLGESCLLSSMGCHFRGPGGAPLLLHSDNGNGMPAPFSATSMVANINYALTPYSREAGALVMVPGSHKLARHPTAHENFRVEGVPTGAALERARSGALNDANWRDPPGVVTMALEPGDAVVWHGNTWHGSFRRDLPGVRMNLSVYFCRQFVQTQERHKGVVPPQVLERHHNDERFNVLLGAKQPYGWLAEGPDYTLMNRNPRGLYD
jgi:hypothetical protein